MHTAGMGFGDPQYSDIYKLENKIADQEKALMELQQLVYDLQHRVTILENEAKAR